MWNKLKSALGLGGDPELAAAQHRMQVDHQDPRKRFVFAVIAISYKADPAYQEGFAKMAIRDWYGIGSPEKLGIRISGFLRGTSSTPAYDAFRATFLARAGVPAGMLTDEESWTWALRAGQMVQRSYPSFMHYGMGYLDGHLAYRQSCGDEPAALERYRHNLLATMNELTRSLWTQISFDTAL